MKRISLVLATAVMLAVGQSLRAQATAAGAAPPAAAATAAAATAPAAAASVDVPVTRIVLFSSGVGYFEHNGNVAGNAAADLRFETAQINDVLKSLVVYDHSGGHVNTITYPANDPVNRTLRSFEVNLSGDPPMAEILKQIRGAKVSINVADETISGLILGVESKEHALGKGDTDKTVTEWFVNIITDDGIRTVGLDGIRKLSILDDKIKQEMQQALAALVQARDQSKKTVTVHFDGTGKRDVGMGYLVETPVWKTSYRLLLPDPKSANTADLQAWAIVENQTDNDWRDVSLSLVGGRPISFIEMLYQPLYVSRPVLSPSIIGSIVPQTYDNGLAPPEGSGIGMEIDGRSVGGNALGGIAMQRKTSRDVFSNGGALNSAVPNALVTTAAGGINGGPATGLTDAAGNPMVDFGQGVSSIAEATKIGEMFHFSVDHVSLSRQQSSMIPIITEGVKFDRVSIYSPGISTKYAMRGARLYNATGKYLLGGPVTVMDTAKEGHSYAGDAKIEDIPPGQSRLLTYAIDQETVIQAVRDEAEDAITTGSIVKGVLWLKHRSQLPSVYTLQNKGDGEKTLILEHPLVDDFDLKEPAKPAEKTDKAYRFEVKLAAHETKTFKVVLERTRDESVSLLNMENGPLVTYTQEGGIPAKVKEALQTIAGKRAAIADLQQTISKAQADRTQILQEQANIRENIKVLPTGTSMDAAVKDLTAHDEDLKALNKSLKDLQASLDAARADLTKFIQSTTLE